MRMRSAKSRRYPGHLCLTIGVGVLIALILVLSWPVPAQATTLEKMTIEQLSQRATTIVEGTVLSTAVEQSSFGVRTAVSIRVRDSLKGSGSAVQTVYVPGGTLSNGTQVVVDGMASFTPGQSCYVFVDRRGWVMGGFQGKLGVENGRVVGTGESVRTMNRRVRAALGAAAPVVEGQAFAGPKPAAEFVAHPAATSVPARPLPLTALSSTWLGDGFESGSLAGWTVIDPSTWGVTTYRAASGNYSAYCLGSIAPRTYGNNFLARMTRGPFNLSGAAGTPTLTADLWLESEANYDYAKLLVSTDGSSYYGNVWWGSSGGAWVGVGLDLTNVYVLGDVSHAPTLYVMLAFESDVSTPATKGRTSTTSFWPPTPPPPGSPTISSISPSEASAGTDTHVTISGSGFGSSTGKVEFSYGRNDVTRISASDISSWSDTSINCAVPTGIIDNYSASAGTGPVVVTTSAAAESNPTPSPYRSATEGQSGRVPD